MSSWRTRFAAIAGLVVLAAGLLAAGWITASARDRRARAALERMSDRAVLANAERAVSSRVDELVSRESERPFYVYSHFYIPPDLLTISDAIAVSTLSNEHPEAPMIGWFQVDPDGTVRTPLTPEPSTSPEGVEARLVALARSPAVDPLRASILHSEPGALVARAPSVTEPEPVQVLVASLEPAPEPVPIPVALNLQANVLANDIQRAQAGDPVSFERASQSNRAPVVAQIVQQSFGSIPRQASSAPEPQLAPEVLLPQASSASNAGAPSPSPPRRVVRRVRRPAPDRPPPAPPRVPAETAVHYERMRLLDTPSDAPLVLARVVSSVAGPGEQTAAVVQGAVVDRASFVAMLRDAARSASTDARRVDVGEGASCALTRRRASWPTGLSLCLRSQTSAAIAAADARALRADVSLVALLVSLVVLALGMLARVAKREAELAERRRDFVSAVSHELRTPLTTLRMHAEMLREGMVDDARRPRVHDELVRETSRMSRLVENVLEVSRLEAGKRVVAKVEGDLRAVVARTLEEHDEIVRAAGMQAVLAEGAAVRANFDASSVERIVTNLLDNAVKYASSASDRRIEVDVRADGEGARITVSDHGPGIPQSERERVFERFHRVPRASDAHRPGTGLGLSLVRELAREHGGDATVEPTPGGGARVVVVL